MLIIITIWILKRPRHFYYKFNCSYIFIPNYQFVYYDEINYIDIF
jgi:hypothetical protein